MDIKGYNSLVVQHINTVLKYNFRLKCKLEVRMWTHIPGGDINQNNHIGGKFGNINKIKCIPPLGSEFVLQIHTWINYWPCKQEYTYIHI